MNRRPVNTIAQAIAFLRSIEVQVVGNWHGWVLRGTGKHNDDFELLFERNAELIDYARSERDVCYKLCREFGVKRMADLPKALSHSSTPEADTPAAATSSCGPSAENEEAKEVRT